MENKKSVLVGIIVFLILVVLGLGGYIVYDKVFSEEKIIVDPTESPQVEKDITDSALAKRLYEALNSTEFSGLQTTMHYKKASNTDEAGINYMVTVAVLDHLKTENVRIYDYIGSSVGGKEYVMDEKVITSYIQNHFGTMVDYQSFAKEDFVSLGHTGLLGRYVLKNHQFEIYRKAAGTNGRDGSYSKFMKALQQKDTITVYDSFFQISWDGTIGYGIRPLMGDEMEKEYVCSTEQGEKPLCNDMISHAQDQDKEKVYSYVTTNFPSYVGNFKHTFQKNEDGNYVWVRTEMIG